MPLSNAIEAFPFESVCDLVESVPLLDKRSDPAESQPNTKHTPNIAKRVVATLSVGIPSMAATERSLGRK